MRSEFNKLCGLYSDREYAGRTISLNNVSRSEIRSLEILGETIENGAGDKSPDNPYELEGSKPVLRVCGENILSTDEEQRVRMVSRNIYSMSEDAFEDYSSNFSIEGDSFYINKEIVNSGESDIYPTIYYKASDNFKENTEYTLICEILEADCSSDVGIRITNSWNYNYFPILGDTFNDLKTGDILKNNLKTKADFSSLTRAMTTIIIIPVGARITALKFRISVIAADDVDLDGFMYETYKDDYELNSVGDVADSYEPLTGEYVQRVGKLVLNGSEDWSDTFYSTLGFFQISNVSGLTDNDRNNILCDRFVTQSSGYKHQNAIFKQANYKVIRISPSTDIAEDLESFKEYLAANNAVVYYELETPITRTVNKVSIRANIPCTTMYIDGDGGSIKATLQTKGR